jgi:phenylacetate-coenzyme A ligase PaaK-like adenylate-forming protein
MRLDDPALDGTASEARDALLVAALRRQIAFMRAEVPFWHERLATLAVDEDRIETMADLSQFPVLSKDELRAIRPTALLPAGRLLDMKVCRWTSGTTGRPTVNFWSETDWAALVASTARMLVRQAPMQSPTVFNGYSHSHVTGLLYNAVLRQLGGVVYDRSHHPEELFSTVAQMELFDFDTLILPERTKRGKGVGLADLLSDDPHLLTRRGVRWWIGSSGTFDAKTLASVWKQGIASVSNLYGASEFGLFAISCPKIPGDYHVAQGHVLVEVVDRFGVPVGNGESGRIVVTHLCGMEENGQARVYRGTQILRLAGGDGATFLSDACDCGLTAPRLRNVQRLGRNAA